MAEEYYDLDDVLPHSPSMDAVVVDYGPEVPPISDPQTVEDDFFAQFPFMPEVFGDGQDSEDDSEYSHLESV